MRQWITAVLLLSQLLAAVCMADASTRSKMPVVVTAMGLAALGVAVAAVWIHLPSPLLRQTFHLPSPPNVIVVPAHVAERPLFKQLGTNSLTLNFHLNSRGEGFVWNPTRCACHAPCIWRQCEDYIWPWRISPRKGTRVNPGRGVDRSCVGRAGCCFLGAAASAVTRSIWMPRACSSRNRSRR